MGSPRKSPRAIAALRRELLHWYACNHRDLPWRRTRDPYAIWVSEIMLQQTRVAAVIDRYTAFLRRFPTLASLARAPEQQVLALWSGLGYYRRARMMHRAAQAVLAEHSGLLPPTPAELRKLPGIGAYTAAAIASIAHGEPAAVVDGNVERVLCRLRGWDADAGVALRRKVEFLAAELLDPASPGDFNQAMMELGATVCLPRNPLCSACPLAAQCQTRGEHKTTPRPRMHSREAACALALRNGRGASQVLLEQRPATESVMPGMWQLPALREAEIPADQLRMTVRHAIMQVNFVVRVRSVGEKDVASLTVRAGRRRWVPLEETGAMALTGLARKVLTRAHLLPAASSSAVASRHRADVP